ncbi:conserved hypothetical protein [Tenacibaculum sediminilitoris]|uniref:DUF3179 domain-containing protein n=1 Tax=Tenacibaculum sediminilitoris TaxID=1820334 RepID=UPI0038959FB9
MKLKLTYFLFLLIVLNSCSRGNEENDVEDTEETTSSFTKWLIPKDEIFDGSGKDGIPSIDNPKFILGNDDRVNEYMNDADLVVGIKLGNEVRAYPHKILDWHEVINDNIGGRNVTVNYCPLTGTAFAWEFISDNKAATFGVSGLLYNSNLILYDRQTDSHWSQMELKCVNGKEIESKPNLIEVVETNWKTWKNSYPNTTILLDKQGFDRNYQVYPYGGYLDRDDFLLFPVKPLDDRLPEKQRVHGVISGKQLKAYRFKFFENGNVIRDFFAGNNLLLIGNENIIKSYVIPGDLLDLDFSYTYDDGESFFEDNTGNKWSIFGEVIEGPALGRKMLAAKSVTGYWFSLASFYPNPTIY